VVGGGCATAAGQHAEEQTTAAAKKALQSDKPLTPDQQSAYDALVASGTRPEDARIHVRSFGAHKDALAEGAGRGVGIATETATDLAIGAAAGKALQKAGELLGRLGQRVRRNKGSSGPGRPDGGYASEGSEFADDSLRMGGQSPGAPRAEDHDTWVDEGGNLRGGGSPGMRPDAYRYQAGAPGARSNAVTGRGQAPYLEFTDDAGNTVGAKFDGVQGAELIDRKMNPVFSPKAVDQAARQAAVARHYGLKAVWELPSQEAVDAANRFMHANNVNGISVRLAKP
jgi:hypothetical protein